MPAGNDAPIGYRGACIAACVLTPGCADPAPVIHYAPAENLEHVDVDLIDRAQHEIDMAAYVLTDWPILQALTRAADRGVAIPHLFSMAPSLPKREPTKVFNDLAEMPGVEIRDQAHGQRTEATPPVP